MRKLLLVALVSSLALPARASAQAAAPSGDLAAGIRQVEEGDLEAAVITLDTVIQRLKPEKGREKDLGTAHLYLAMAHLGLSQWERAKGEMREAWRNNPQLVLDPKKFPPRVIQLYEQTRQENKPAPAAPPKATPAAPAAPRATPAPPKKGGSKTVPILIGVGVAAGAGVGIAAGGGGGGSPSTPTTTTTLPSSTPTAVTFSGTPTCGGSATTGSGFYREFNLSRPGVVSGAVTALSARGFRGWVRVDACQSGGTSLVCSSLTACAYYDCDAADPCPGFCPQLPLGAPASLSLPAGAYRVGASLEGNCVPGTTLTITVEAKSSN